jgi:hypothetical protein
MSGALLVCFLSLLAGCGGTIGSFENVHLIRVIFCSSAGSGADPSPLLLRQASAPAIRDGVSRRGGIFRGEGIWQWGTSAGENNADRVLYERAMAFMQDENFQVATTLLETLVASYPESPYSVPANAALNDIWYAEGCVGPRPEPVNGETVKFFPPLPETQN